MTTIVLFLLIIVLMSQSEMNNLPNPSDSTVANTAKTERSVRVAWEKCVDAEEANRMFKKLLAEGVGTDKIECYSRSKAGREKWVNRGEEGRKQVVLDEV